LDVFPIIIGMVFLGPGFSRILIFFFFGIGFKNGFKKEEVD
jgi:hypothetical protein